MPTGATITRDLTGAISNCLPGQMSGCGITRPWLNLAMLDYTGIDLRIDYNVPLDGGSELNFRWTHSHMLEANEQTTPLSIVEDVAGTQDTPSFRSVLVTNWSMGDHNVSLITSYIDSYVNSNDEKIPSWVTWDLQWSWDITANGRIVAGVLNLTDEDPPLDDFNDTVQPFNSELYSMDGRVPYLQYRHTF
jgi:outer membrane receptor for ferrienterochelin and colicin